VVDPGNPSYHNTPRKPNPPRKWGGWDFWDGWDDSCARNVRTLWLAGRSAATLGVMAAAASGSLLRTGPAGLRPRQGRTGTEAEAGPDRD
jgi:hypothetical protein